MATPSYTCITCRVSFLDANLQRAHYKTDWHRYNLKRKVAELPPVTALNFRDRVLNQQAAVEEEKHKVCQVCRKHFSSKNAYSSHLRSRKHQYNALYSGSNGSNDSDSQKNVKEIIELSDTKKEENEAPIESDYEPEPLEMTECLFCTHESENFEASLKHMSVKHGFFIPDIKYLIDIRGLIKYLCEKVGVGYMCIWCNLNGKAFHSVESVQQHMVDKCHCRLFFEGEAALEYAEYYDYSSSYPDEDDTATSDGGTDNIVIPDSSLKISEDLQLVLPSGTKIGHRSLKHTFKQHLPTLEQRKATLVTRLMAQYRALGWKESGNDGTAIKRRDEKWALRMKQAKETKLRVKANKFQEHFRPQVVF